MKTKIAFSTHAGRWFGRGFMMKSNSLLRRLAGDLPGVLLRLAVLPLAALGQASYPTPYTFTTLAGVPGSSGSADGTNGTARFYYPYGVAVDMIGNLYVSDSGNQTIRKVTPVGTNWVVRTLAGKAGVAGSADGTNSTAQFNFGNTNLVGGCLGVDSAGNIYVPDTLNNTIREVTLVGTNWVVTTLAGKAGVAGSTDGTNSAARFNYPAAVAVDANSNLYVADTLNDTIREVTLVGTNWVVTTLAGKAGTSGSTDGTNSAARFNYPAAVAVDMIGNLYVADWANDTIRKVALVGTNWVVTTLAGKAGYTGSADGTGSTARFNGPDDVAADSASNVYVGDSVNNTIRKVTPVGTNWMVTTLAGKAGYTGSANGTGSAARFNFGYGDAGCVAVDSAGNLYVADYVNHTIRKGYPALAIISSAPGFGFNRGLFGLTLTGPSGQLVVVEASTDLSNWLPLWTNTLTFPDALTFSDPQSGVYPNRFYRAYLP